MVREVMMPTEKKQMVASVHWSFIHKNASIIIFSVFEEEDQSAFNLTVFVCLFWLKNVFIAFWF